MRINKKNPTHWYYLVRSGVNICVSVPFRLFRNKDGHKKIIFYDQMNGNTKAFVDYLNHNHKNEYELYFLAFPPYHNLFPVDRNKIRPISMLSLKDMIKVARSDVVVTAFGIQTLIYYNKLTSIKFVDVWHGLPFRGYTKDDFRYFKSYTEAWVSSPALKKFYESWGWRKDKVHITGYARVDSLVNKSHSLGELRNKYKIGTQYKKIILIAPTWEQKDHNHNPFPFGSSATEFLHSLNDTARDLKSLVIFRTHLHTGSKIDIDSLSHVRVMPASSYPNTEEMLYLSDVLISDWSSIVFDYLPLQRPTIFLDVPYPYKDGFTIGKEYRFGQVVSSVDEMVSSIKLSIINPKEYLKKYSLLMNKTRDYVWSATLDGESAKRYYERLQELLE